VPADCDWLPDLYFHFLWSPPGTPGSPAESQRKHLGYALVQDLQAHYKRLGTGMLTVNTQNNNHASLALYRKMGFFQTGESFPVFIYP